MLTFMVLLFASAVIAAPQYNYQQNIGHAGSIQQGVFAAQSTLVGSQNHASGLIPSVAAVQQQVQHVAPQVVYNKQIFIHSAPQDDALEGVGASNENVVLKKNLRVVIVRAPENKGLTDAALQLAKSASEDKTVVYVLNKQTDLGELQNQLSQIQASNPNKPEVHFVKYRTPEEAEHAQHSIQSQYDSFGGPTQVLDEGVAPVESFIGSLGGGAGSLGAGSLGVGSLGAGSTQGGAQSQNYGTVSNAYLPSVRLY